MTDKKAPWDKKPPQKRSGNHKMTESQKEEARARAFKAGRPYPNLIDNMAVLRQGRKREDLP